MNHSHEHKKIMCENKRLVNKKETKQAVHI